MSDDNYRASLYAEVQMLRELLQTQHDEHARVFNRLHANFEKLWKKIPGAWYCLKCGHASDSEPMDAHKCEVRR